MNPPRPTSYAEMETYYKGRRKYARVDSLKRAWWLHVYDSNGSAA